MSSILDDVHPNCGEEIFPLACFAEIESANEARKIWRLQVIRQFAQELPP
jgi:hypothetical protein